MPEVQHLRRGEGEGSVCGASGSMAESFALVDCPDCLLATAVELCRDFNNHEMSVIILENLQRANSNMRPVIGKVLEMLT